MDFMQLLNFNFKKPTLNEQEQKLYDKQCDLKKNLEKLYSRLDALNLLGRNQKFDYFTTLVKPFFVDLTNSLATIYNLSSIKNISEIKSFLLQIKDKDFTKKFEDKKIFDILVKEEFNEKEVDLILNFLDEYFSDIVSIIKNYIKTNLNTSLNTFFQRLYIQVGSAIAILIVLMFLVFYIATGNSRLNEEFITAVEQGNKPKVEKMISEKKIDINYPGKRFKATALLWASLKGHKEIVEFLLKNGANPNIKNYTGDTAFTFAKDKPEIINMLYVYQNVKNEEFIKAAELGNLELIKKIIKSNTVPINYLDNGYKASALSWAAFKGHKDVIEYLIQNGADPHIKNNLGLNAIDLANSSNFKEVADYLTNLIVKGEEFISFCENGDIVKVKEYIENKIVPINYVGIRAKATGLMWGTFKKHKDIVKYLVQKGADVNLKNESNATALQIAQLPEINDKEIIEMLKKSGGK
ncbi:MAG: hypothetical protein A2Y34_13510 [Spirochaetes bacterium GWC1_27_15]|nr:MAG: hypothetical protein A2Z98_01945 [Spirochaetes bacterium GWB1_27_13]OHD24993.1 MAG: hypothetical protein A2Y34_13510 [Spirochaetes bacterium GWC1_27_15]